VDVYLLIKDVYDQKYQPIDNWSILIYDHTYTINFPSDSSDSTITLLDHVHSKYIKNSTDKTITVTVNGSDSTNKGTFTVDNGKQVTWYNEASGFASLDIVVGTQKITLSHSGGTNSKGDSSYTLNDIIGLEINMQQDSSNSPAYVVVGIEDNHGKFSQYVPDKPSGTPQASTLMYLDVQCTSEKNIRLQYYNASNQLLQSFPYDGSSQLIDFVVSNTHGSRLTTATYDPSLIDHIVCTVGTGSSTTNFVADSTFNPLTIFASQATALKNGIDASPGTKMATVSFGAQNSDGSIPVSFFVDSNSTDGLYSTKITTTASGSGSTTTNSNYKLNNTSGWDLDISIIKKDNSLSSSVRVTKDNKPQNIYYDTNDIKGIQISPVLTTSGAPIAVLNTLIWYTGDSKVQNVLQSAEAIAFNNIDGVSNDKSTGVHVYFYSSKTDLSKSSLDILLPNSSSSGSITNAIT
ncbi:hypothetical protein EBQ93_00465, partial [bacterium]|nr:hypothetical protein [bacterium]